MRKLLIQLFFLLGTVALVLCLAYWWVFRHPYFDEYYARFASPSAGSLVLGTSRAAQAVIPTVLQAQLGQRYEGPWLNYSFTLPQSPYGPTYLASIRRKLAPATRRGLFIVTVDAWSLSLPNPTSARPTVVFAEEKSLLGRFHTVSQQPNFDYLLHNTPSPLYSLLLTDFDAAPMHLHADGWLEVLHRPPLPHTTQLKNPILHTYQHLAASQHLSPERLASLRQLLYFLKPHGQVVLVRLPNSAAFFAMEQRYQPQFDALMTQTSAALGVPYLNYSRCSYATTDGNHLWSGAARDFSRRLAQDIAALPSH
ncbi:MAG: hypothetical protein ACRYF0_13345 [Janthinobacterium lividum]